jgi:hypothetical protein
MGPIEWGVALDVDLVAFGLSSSPRAFKKAFEAEMLRGGGRGNWEKGIVGLEESLGLGRESSLKRSVAEEVEKSITARLVPRRVLLA